MRTRIITAALVVVAAVYVADRLFEVEWPSGAVWPLRILLIVAAVLIAGIAYQLWSTGDPKSPRPIVAMVTSLIGGACLASAVTSAPDGTIVGTGLLGAVSLVALAFGATVLNIEARETNGR
ncbi:hypothetical protein GCM10009710_24960 [Aeromicrobium alkaliterrae]|uniref:Integral membrane protein n=1 Tax=Aeromicrobium alkaliterrae TaxID=302168 RepID=A0ABP4W178_9ACTN